MAMIEDLIEFLQSEPEDLILLWDRIEGWHPVNSESRFFQYWKPEEVSLKGLRSLVVESDRPVYDVFLKRIETDIRGEGEICGTDAGRTYASVRMQQEEGIGYYNVECRFHRNADHCISKMLVLVQQMDAEEVYRMKLAHTITNDSTPSFFATTAREIMVKNPDKKYAIIQFDVAKFKVINEIYGEVRGDEILQFFIDTLKVVCHENQLYVRLSADVFMILTPYEELEDINRFIDLLDQNLLGYKDMNYTLVYGVCLIRDMKDGLRKYGDSAALARQSIKGDALTHVAFFEDKMKEGIYTRKFIEDNMKKALKNKEFVMYLQPKYSISQNCMVGAEALVRWIHPEKGIIPPMEFIPLFEKNGFVIKMDQYIWEEACKTIRQWMDDGIEPLPISVNVSRRNLRDNQFIDVLNGLIDKYQIPKKYLEIEITETIEDAQVNNGVTLLKENGYTLLMDDFGSGYSSLNMLKDTQFDVIKMDRGFLQDFIGSERGQRIVEHTIKMTADIGLDMVAEGVETQEQAAFLEKCGCDTAQGFYYDRPMTLEDFNKKMTK
ncbi:MAG: GGDEF domain-containing phosphodiesterase [Lachnospiraceae bacterium]|nr:GGDEF domain-containing phosphodiesterase [Lachnospiraceae bacterium]